jgi:hypothetical protein
MMIDLQSVPCRACGAGVGQECRAPGGDPLPGIHDVRENDAIAAETAAATDPFTGLPGD